MLFCFLSAVCRKQPCAREILSASHGNKHQHDHHRNGDEAAAAASVSTTAATIVVAAATAAGRAAEVAVERRHVLGISCICLAILFVILGIGINL